MNSPSRHRDWDWVPLAHAAGRGHVAFVVLYDACVLYPFHLRDVLIRVGQAGLVQAKWTDQILDEAFESVLANRPDLDPESLARTRCLMGEAIPDALVTEHEALIDGLELPDPDDRHVLAAAIRANAQVIVTSNLTDFPDHRLKRFGIEAQSPDEFLHHLVDLAPQTILGLISNAATCLQDPPLSVHDLLDLLERDGLAEAVGELRRHLNF